MASSGMSSETGGVKPMAIGGRLVRERERLFGMSDAERAWRKQFLKDQILAPHEPVHVPQYYREITNPIRRFYQWPLNKLWEILTPSLGGQRAYAVRFWIGKGLMITGGIYAAFYYFKYNTNDWTRKGGWRVIKSRRAVVPGEVNYPAVSDRSKPSDYAARGFNESPI
ncbi:uncharacterized protein LOC129807951 [Phlebotomus papatasi]|uniref:Uncharacterized protein n=1 Tax=Phlebotomus papatasi TaxID=29031 RepID=A0A1B0D6Z1_PHLPP|nr:uncharacterized protein LOC129807951 [Phlebotomus papatasi]